MRAQTRLLAKLCGAGPCLWSTKVEGRSRGWRRWARWVRAPGRPRPGWTRGPHGAQSALARRWRVRPAAGTWPRIPLGPRTLRRDAAQLPAPPPALPPRASGPRYRPRLGRPFWSSAVGRDWLSMSTGLRCYFLIFCGAPFTPDNCNQHKAQKGCSGHLTRVGRTPRQPAARAPGSGLAGVHPVLRVQEEPGSRRRAVPRRGLWG